MINAFIEWVAPTQSFVFITPYPIDQYRIMIAQKAKSRSTFMMRKVDLEITDEPDGTFNLNIRRLSARAECTIQPLNNGFLQIEGTAQLNLLWAIIPLVGILIWICIIASGVISGLASQNQPSALFVGLTVLTIAFAYFILIVRTQRVATLSHIDSLLGLLIQTD